MALVSKSKAAILAGVSRTTIHRYVNNGKLSMTGDQVDTSELIRVFGSIQDVTGGQDSTGVQVNTVEQDATPQIETMLHQQIRTLEGQISDLRGERDNWRQKSDELIELLKVEQETKLLTHSRKDNNLNFLAFGGLVVVMVLIAIQFFRG